MAEKPVTGRREGVSDEALAAATGKTWAEWFAILDAEGATDWKHSVIARWLDAHYPLGGWWAQGVTVGYEQARGIRAPGQRQDGSFEASVSKTLPLEQLSALDALIAVVSAELGAPASESRAAKHVTARWSMPVGSLLASAAPPKAANTAAASTAAANTAANTAGGKTAGGKTAGGKTAGGKTAGGKTAVGLTWQRLASAEDVAPAKQRMQGWLQAAARVG